jgi:hypothetical protein
LDISPGEVAIGGEADISVVVTNTSESAGNYQVTLNINGAIVDAKEVLLAGRTSRPVVFTVVPDTAGKKIIDVNGLMGGLVVTGEVPPPSQIPLPLDKEEVTPSVPAQTLPDEAPAPESNRWIIIIVVAGCVIIAALLLYFTWWRKRGTSKPS